MSHQTICNISLQNVPVILGVLCTRSYIMSVHAVILKILVVFWNHPDMDQKKKKSCISDHEKTKKVVWKNIKHRKLLSFS